MLDAQNDLLNVEELCEVLMIGKNSAYELLSGGELKAFREGTRWKIPKVSIELYIRRRAGL